MLDKERGKINERVKRIAQICDERFGCFIDQGWRPRLMTVLLFNDCYIILKNDDKRRKIRFSTDCNHHCTGRSLYVSRYIRLRGFFSSFSSSLLLSVHLDSSPSASRLFSLSFSFCCSFFILFLLCSFFFTPPFRSLQKTFFFSPFPFCHIGFTR